MEDARAEGARFYDLNPRFPEDVPFYRAHLPIPEPNLLEVGCGTGRVLLPISSHCRTAYGIEASPAMLEICNAKLRAAGVPASKVGTQLADATRFDLGRRFDWIIAPFRVLQNLETDAEVSGFLASIRTHLEPSGRCVLSAFNPSIPSSRLSEDWLRDGETFCWEVETEGARVTCHDRRRRFDAERRVAYPDLVYRRFRGAVLEREVVMPITMRCWYPEELTRLLRDHGFEIAGQWGGYAGEAYGEGPELVVEVAAH